MSESGNKVLVEATSSVDEYESIARHISVISGGHAAVVDTPLTKELAKKCVIPNTLSLCIQLGMVREQSEEKGKDPVQAVVSKLKNGKVIFKGVVSKYKWEDKAGFLFGEATLEGVGEWRSHTLKSWIKNEHIFAFLDDKPYVMPPDLYTFVTPLSAVSGYKGLYWFMKYTCGCVSGCTPRGREHREAVRGAKELFTPTRV